MRPELILTWSAVFKFTLHIEAEVWYNIRKEQGQVPVICSKYGTYVLDNDTEDNEEMPFTYGFYELFLIFIFWGIIGWLIEVVDMRIEAGEFQNRGFLHMPFCPMYGAGMAAASVSLSGVKNSYLILFAFGMIFCSLLEYIVGGIMEKLFHSKWWDYSHMRFNIKGRVCLRNAILFGFASILVFRFVEPMVEMVIVQIPMNVRVLITGIFGILFVIDMVISARRAWAYRKDYGSGELQLIFKAHR